MMALLRETFAGSLIRSLTKSSFLKFPDERSDFTLPEEYTAGSHQSTTDSNAIDGVKQGAQVLVSWYSDHDPENPQNWSSTKKTWVSTLLFAYTFTAYLGSSIYTASIPGIVDEFGVSQTVASLGLSLYVAAYGIAPMVLAPLSEIPAIGRNPPYSITFSLFALLCIAVPLVDDFAGLLVLRFLLGLLSSPALATGGASYGDFFGSEQMQYVIVLWGGGATLAPVSTHLPSIKLTTDLKPTGVRSSSGRVCGREDGLALERLGNALAVRTHRRSHRVHAPGNLQ